MYCCLRKYGFSENFINLVKIIYNKVQANVMINGFKSNLINIEQSVKQKDALSCDLFVICVDPLLRKINSEPILQNPIHSADNSKIDNTAGYADDVAALIEATEGCIQRLLDIYNNFSASSGLHLNPEKTEILAKSRQTFQVSNNDTTITLNTTDRVKTCGRTFSYDTEHESQENITSKIDKLKTRLNSWRS